MEATKLDVSKTTVCAVGSRAGKQVAWGMMFAFLKAGELPHETAHLMQLLINLSDQEWYHLLGELEAS